jgi:Phosphotransferase enzyme family
VSERRNDLFALVVDDGRVLALRDGGRWTLPRWRTEGLMAWQRSAAANDAVRALIGADVVTLRVVYGERPEDDRRIFVYELAATGEPTEARARWLARDDVEALEDEEQRDLLARWFDEPDDERRVPWAHPGWHVEAHEWIASQIDAAGRQVTGPPEQFGTSSISVVLRIPTDAGDVYFKAVPPLFGHEPALTRELEERHGRRIVPVLATDESRGWMLTADHEGAELDGDDTEALRAIVVAYARIQIAWVGDSSRLAALGCPDRALDALEGELEPTLADDQLLSRLSPDERARLPALSERLRPAFDRLRTHEIPATLEHGDLHGGNLALRPDGPVFFDWTDGCVSVPFFSFVPLFVEEEPSDAAQLIRDAYLEPWFGEVPSDALLQAFELSQELGALHQAVSYRRIIDATEPSQHWQFAPALPYFVRRLLDTGEPR